MSAENKPAQPTPTSIPEWAVHIAQVYAWAEQPRRCGSKITKRAIQWYSSSGLIPSPKRFGKEAYYNKNDIFCYLRVIEILNRKFGLLLSQIRKIIIATEKLADRQTGEICIGVDGDGMDITTLPIKALSDLLEEYLTYEENETSLCNGPNWTREQSSRLNTLSNEIVKRLLGKEKELEKLVAQQGLIGLESELFPEGKEQSGAVVADEDMPF